jgi:hypothetical protein
MHRHELLNDEAQRMKYLQEFCHHPNALWNQCKRYLFHGQMHFCPDEILPDNPLTVDEILDHLDREFSNK